MMWLLIFLACTPKIAPNSVSEFAWPSNPAPETTAYIHHSATTKISPQLAVMGERGPKTRAPVSSILIEHSVHGLIVVDAGFGSRTAKGVKEIPGRRTAKLLDLQMLQPLSEVLTAKPKHLLFTHMHIDHLAGVEDFPNAQLWADQKEQVFASKKRGLRSTNPELTEGRTIHNIPWKNQAYGPFSDHADLFGDGTIILFKAYGHTPGSVMVMFHTGASTYLYTGDAAWVDENWLHGARPKGWLARNFVEWDYKAGLTALHQIEALHKQVPELKILSGHEPNNLKLPTFPEPLP